MVGTRTIVAATSAVEVGGKSAPALAVPWALMRTGLLAGRSHSLFIVTLLISSFAHAFNMFRFPYFENDEGIYMAQAWAVLTGHGLANYTYWYDHPPVGWMQIAGWLALTGGPTTFGLSVDSGRILMLLFHLGSSALLFAIGRGISGKPAVGAGAALLFSLSPLAVFFQRRILLDNIMTFWVLLAIYLVLCRYRSGLGPIVASSCTFGIALLSKEISIIFVPALLYMLWRVVDKRHRTLAIASWLIIVCSIGSTWLVYALLKGEIFPSGTLLGGSREHVSLYETLEYQVSRGNGHGFFSLENDFWLNMRLYWLPRDPFIIIGGIAATILALFFGFRQRAIWLAAFPGLCILAFLARGSLVIEYYIVPAIPFFALNIALVVSEVLAVGHRAITGRIPRSQRLLPTMVGSVLLLVLAAVIARQLVSSSVIQNNYRADQTTPQREALAWIEANVPHDAFIVTDHYGLLDLNLAGFSKAHSHWKIDRDPDVATTILHGDWRNIDYLLITPQVANDRLANSLPMVGAAFDNSTLSQAFLGGGGWPITVRKIDLLAVSRVNIPAVQVAADGSITVTITADITALKREIDGANLTLEIRNPSGQIVQKAVLNEQIFLQRATQSFAFTLTLPPGSDPVAMTVVLGAFDATWTDAYMWRVYSNLLPSVAGLPARTMMPPAAPPVPEPNSEPPGSSPPPPTMPIRLPLGSSPSPATPPAPGISASQQAREREASLRSGELEATTDYGNGTRSVVQMRFDLGDSGHPQGLYSVSTYVGNTGTRRTERIILGDRGWERAQGGMWSPLATVGSVRDEVMPFLPRLNPVQIPTTTDVQTGAELNWSDTPQGLFKSLQIDPRTGIPQRLRAVAMGNQVTTTVTYLGWNTPVAIDSPENK